LALSAGKSNRLANTRLIAETVEQFLFIDFLLKKK